MPIVSDLINSSFRLIGAIAAGETLETTELNDAFVSLNQMLALWNTEGAMLVSRSQMFTPLQQYIATYLLPARPIRITAASSSINGVDSPLEIVDTAGWENIPVPEKLMQSIFLKRLYCDYAYPSSTVFVWPTPRAAGTLEMWAYVPLAQFATVNDTISLPPGYEQAIRYNFAVALLPEYPRSQADPTLPAQAQAYKASIMQLNMSNQMQAALAQAPGPQVAA